MEKSGKKFCLVLNWPNLILIMHSGYGEQTFFYKNFSFIFEKISSVQWFHFRKRGFVIFLTGATETDFFEIGWWNYMAIASKPHIPFLWRIFLKLGSTSSCCAEPAASFAPKEPEKLERAAEKWFLSFGHQPMPRISLPLSNSLWASITMIQQKC